jgi:hypothetical protein
MIRKTAKLLLALSVVLTGLIVPPAAMQPYVQAAPLNIALNKPIEASSVINNSHRAAVANDGNPNTFYESEYTLPQTLTVDLGTVHAIDRIVMKMPENWKALNATIAIQGSTDNSAYWDIVPSATYYFYPEQKNTVEVHFAAAYTRYVRLYYTARSDRQAGAMGELEIYASPNAPDLIVTDIAWAPANPEPGDPVIFTAEVQNVGSSATPAGLGHKVAFRIDGETVAESAAYDQPIAPGQKILMTAASAWTAEKFSFDIQAVADANGGLGENNEDNNGDYYKVLNVSGNGWQAFFNLKEELGIYDFPEEMLSYELDFTGYAVAKENLKLLQRGMPEPLDYQLSNVVESDGYLVSATLNFRTSLAIGETKRFVLEADPNYVHVSGEPINIVDNGNGTATIEGNLQQIRVPYGSLSDVQIPLRDAPAPLLSIAREPGQWIGQGRFSAPQGITVTSIQGRVIEQGPLFVRYEVSYAISGNRSYTCTLTVFRNEKHVTVDEVYSGFSPGDEAYLIFSYKDGVDPNGRIVMQNAGYYRYSPSNPNYYSGQYGDGIDANGKLPYELGLYSVNSWGVMRSTSFWNDSGQHAILFAVNRLRDWKTQSRQIYEARIAQHLRFYQTATDKYMAARIEGGARYWAVSVIPRSEMVLSGRRSRDFTIVDPVLIDSAWTQIPTTPNLQPGNAPDAKLWAKLSDLSLNKYKDMIFDFPEDVSRKLHVPMQSEHSLDTPAGLWDTSKHNFRFYYYITDKYWDFSSELGGAAWAGRVQQVNFATYANNRDKPGWTLSQRKRARSLLVFFTYAVEDDHILPHKSMLGGHPNFNMDIKAMLGMAAGIFPDHPHAERWKNEFMSNFEEMMEVWARKPNPALNAEGGRWYENLPTYANAMLRGLFAAHEGLIRYDGTDLFTNENLRSVMRWIMNSLTFTERGTAAIPIGAHSAGGARSGEFDGIYEILAELISISDPVLGAQMRWMATGGAEGIKPDLESTLYTDYGPVLRYDPGGPNEAFVYLQQLNGSGYRWSANTNGTVYYTAGGKRWSWNGTEDNGDVVDMSKLPMMNVNGKGLGGHPADGVLYNFGNVQYYKAEAGSSSRPYLSRSVMMVQDRYIALYDDLANEATDGEFVWANRESGLKFELFDNPDFTNPVRSDTEIQRFVANHSWGNAAPDPSMDPDNWSIRWTGLIMPEYSEMYTFHVTVSPGSSAKVWVDGQLVSDTQAGISNPINLTAKQLYDYKIEFVHTTGPASLSIKWSSASQSLLEPVLRDLYRELDQQPYIYTVKDGPGDEHHIVATAPLSVTSAVYGAIINDGTEIVFNSDTEQLVDSGIFRFSGKVGYARSDELALFEGNHVGYDGFLLERLGGDFGVSAHRVNNQRIEGRIAGKSGGTVAITPPEGFSYEQLQVLVDGVPVPHAIVDRSIRIDVAIAQSDGYKSFVITSAPSYAFHDDFEDGDSAGWSVTDGHWEVARTGAGHALHQIEPTGGAATTGSNDWSDYAVEVRIRPSDSNRVDLLGRYLDGNHFYYVQLNLEENRVKLYRKTSDGVALLHSVPLQLDANRTYHVKLSFNGSEIKGYVDGIERVAAMDGAIQAGRIGVRSSAESYFDDVAVSLY